MYYKCELLVDGYSYQVTDNLVNWDDITTSFKRGDYDGVVRSFSTKFEFSNAAYSLLKRVFREKYLQASASVVFYTRNNSWLWNERFRCSLDFSTFQDNGSTISISAVDDSVAALIKSKKGTQYEYVVSELTEGKYLFYDRIDIENNIKYIVVGESTNDDGDTTFEINSNRDNNYATSKDVQAEYTSAEVVKNSGFIYFDIPQDESAYPFFVSESKTVQISLSGILKLKGYNSTNVKSIRVFISRKKRASVSVFNESFTPNGEVHTIQIDTLFSLSLEEKLHVYFEIYRTDAGTKDANVSVDILNGSQFEISFYSRSDSVNIDIVTPVKLLNRLLQSINGGQEGITGEIASGVDKRLDECMIVPAESARGLKNAKLYCSYTKFVDWMNAEFGFVPVIGEDKVAFVHRSSLFSKNIVKDFGDNIRSFEYNVNSALIYSRVRAGYDKQDYDSVNGRDEFHFTNEYTTGVTLTENSLELISPFRADAYGIEFLVQKRGEDTTDSDSDNDVFFVNAKLVSIDGRYRLVRTINGGPSISGVISPDTMFNAVYSPRYMIEANRRFIGAFTNTLDFASSDGNSDVVIDGVPEKIDIQLSEGERLFTVGELSVESGDMKAPEDLTGLISIEKGGETYHGYIKDGKFNYGRAEAVKYTLIVESIK